MKKILLSLLLFCAFFAVTGKAHAQTGPTPCGNPTYFSTWNPATPYVTGNVAIRYGVTFQALSGNTGWDPCTSPSKWTTVIGSSNASGYQYGLNASSSSVAGADIGARANTLFNQLKTAGQTGTVVIDPTAATNSVYAQTTQIVIPLGDTLDCQGSNLNWTGTALGGPVAYTGATQAVKPGGIQNCYLIGAGGTSGNSSIGFYAGGDPNNVLTPSTNYGNFFFIKNSVIAGFGKGYTHGNNTWANVIDGSYFLSNYDHIYSSSSSSTNNGEATKIVNSNLYDANDCAFNLNWAGDAYYMIGGHLDFNINGGVCGDWADIQLQNIWMESYYGPGINIVGTGVQSYISVTGGHMVLDATPLTITNVAINGSDVLTLTTTGGAPNGYWVGKPLYMSGLTTATFLNGTTGTIISATTGTVTLSYSHATYASAPDTGTVVQYSPDLYHMEGSPGSSVLVTGVHQIIATSAQVTVGTIPAVVGLGSTTQSTVCVKDLIGPQYGITGTYFTGCLYDTRVQIRGGQGSTLASFGADSTSTPPVATQGWTYEWSTFGYGETDLINIHGLGVGGFYLCDVADGTEPTYAACQLHLDAEGNLTVLGTVSGTNTPATLTGLRYANGASADTAATTAQVQGVIGAGVYDASGAAATAQSNAEAYAVTAVPANTTAFTHTQTAPQFNLPMGAAGPNVSYFNDFFYTADIVANAIGSPVSDGCVSTGASDSNHPGTFLVESGTLINTGVSCIVGANHQIYNPFSTVWNWESVVEPTVLPGTTASSYQAGLVATLGVNPWTTGIAFYLSSANANANHWYCQYGSTTVDSGVSATVEWHRLTMVNNGTNLLWSIDGSQVCSVAVGSLPTNADDYMAVWSSTTLTASTDVNFEVDYINFNETVTR